VVVRVGFLRWWELFLRSSELKTWPFWRTRARGSAIFDESGGVACVARLRAGSL
jgi:hypothetical protein